MEIDFIFKDSGTRVFLTPLSEKALKWSSENINAAIWQNTDSIEIESRLFDDIAEAIKRDGLTLVNVEAK
jgi:hypothetical protein